MTVPDYPEVLVGIPTIVGALRLPQRIGWQNATERLLTGDRIDAARALAARLCRGSPLAARATKEMAVRGPDLPMVDAPRWTGR